MELNPPVALRYDLYRRTGADLSPKERSPTQLKSPGTGRQLIAPGWRPVPHF